MSADVVKSGFCTSVLLSSVVSHVVWGVTESRSIRQASWGDVSSTISFSVRELSEEKSVYSELLPPFNLMEESTTSYTQKQLVCAEKFGVDPVACNEEGRLINEELRSEKKLDKRSETDDQGTCALRLGKALEVCNEHGVFIARTSHVMSAIRRLLSDKLPADWTVFDLSSIQELAITNKIIGKFDYHDFDGLDGLRFLYLYRNQLTEISPGIGDLTQLESINFSQNRLTELPVELSKLSKLRIMSLDSNQLKEFPSKYGDLRSLNHLDLTNNQLTKLPDEIGDLSKLQSLFLGGNQLSMLPVSIRKLSSLNVLTLFMNNLELSPDVFDALLRIPLPVKIYYRDLRSEINPFVVLGDNPVSLSNLVTPFFSHDKTTYTYYFEPNLIKVSDFSPSLTQDQEWFMCAYLLDELKRSSEKKAHEQVEFCKEQYEPTQESNSNDENHNYSIVIGLSVGLSATLGMLVLGFLAGVFFKYFPFTRCLPTEF